MSWIQTFTGRQFFPLEPRAADLDIRDVAHSLAFQCRFNGHCRVFYSVAQHSVLISRELPAELRLWGLLHDAAEAYLGDITRPVKRNSPWFREAEEKLLRFIAGEFGLSWPMPAAVLEADNRMLATEARDLMEPPPTNWLLDAEPYAEPIAPLGPTEAETLFIERYRELTT